MAFHLNWTIEGEVQLSRNLRILADRMEDWTPAYKETAVTLTDLFSGKVFNTEGKAIGEHWSPLSRAYAYKKERMYPGKGILEATGKMRRNFQGSWDSTMALIWNDTPYFKYHQSNQPRSRLPRRVMMKLGNTQKEMIVKIFQTHFHNKVNK